MKAFLLKPGDTIALFAPARWVTPSQIKDAISLYSSWGLKVEVPNYLYNTHHIFSETETNRAKNFLELWQNPNIKAIICARGGYGCIQFAQLLPKLNTFKWLIGYSDVTTLHLMLNKQNIPSMHGPMAINYSQPNAFTSFNALQLKKALFNGTISINCKKLPMYNKAPFSGKVVGGNLSLIHSSLGGSMQLNTKGKVLFIEEIGEYVYHIDRMLRSLEQAGIFNQLKGLIIGSFSKIKDNKIAFGKTAYQIILELCLAKGYPIITKVPIGHGAKNYSLALGINCTFDGNFISQTI